MQEVFVHYTEIVYINNSGLFFIIYEHSLTTLNPESKLTIKTEYTQPWESGMVGQHANSPTHPA